MRRNDPRQYDDLASEWWRPDGAFAMLHWLAAARAELVPPARPEAVLVDIGCGGGLNTAHIRGYRHIGVDIGHRNLRLAAEHGILAAQADAMSLPLADGCADVVIAGEILEHVGDWRAAVREACRVLRPGGTLIIDTIADTRRGRFVAVSVAERLPGGPPPGIHDPRLFVPPDGLAAECARHSVPVRLWGIRPAVLPAVGWWWRRWRRRRSTTVPLVRTRSTAVLYAGKGVKDA